MARRPAVLLALTLFALACQRGSPGAADAAQGRPAVAAAAEPGIVLDAAAQERLGVRLATLEAAAVADRIVGFGIVESAAALAQLDAESSQARAVAAAAQAALARAEALYADQEGTSLAVVEAARRDAAAAAAAVDLVERRLAIDWGAGAQLVASSSSRGAWLKSLIAGRAALVRAQFPAGTGFDPQTAQLEVDPFSRGGAPLAARHVWAAPGDPGVPGLALFLLVEAPQAPQPGDRVRVVAQGTVRPGVVVPASSLVLADGATWCYVLVASANGQPERFVRRALAIDRPEAAGYFVAAGLAPGDRVVVAGGGSLLAEEVGAAAGAAGSATAGDDED